MLRLHKKKAVEEAAAPSPSPAPDASNVVDV